jgi:hypothetical protein
MGGRVLKFSTDHPDSSAGYATALAQLKERLARARQLGEQQRLGISQVRSASREKAKLRKQLRSSHLVHLATIAQGVATMPELAARFVLQPVNAPYMTFRTSAGGMVAEAEGNLDVLVQHGLAESVLESLKKALQRFDEEVDRFNAGRAAHVGASAELEVVARDVVQIVTAMDGLNRARFAEDAEQLAAWTSASNTFGPVHTSEQPSAPEVTPPSGGESSKSA